MSNPACKYEVPPRRKLQSARQQVGMTQRQLAELCGVKVETVRFYEQGRMGRRTALSANTLLKFIEEINRRAGEMRLPIDLRPHILCPDDFDAPAPTE